MQTKQAPPPVKNVIYQPAKYIWMFFLGIALDRYKDEVNNWFKNTLNRMLYETHLI